MNRRCEVLILLRSGLSLKEISERLNISYGYVRRLVCELRKEGKIGYLRRGRPSKRVSLGKASKQARKVTFSEGSRKFHQKRYLSILNGASALDSHKNVTSVALPEKYSPVHIFSVLSTREVKVLRALFLKGRKLDNVMTVRELAKITGISRRTLYRVLGRLTRLGLINRLGWGLYSINEISMLLLLGNVFAGGNSVPHEKTLPRVVKSTTTSFEVVQGHQLKYLPLPPLEWVPYGYGGVFLHGGMFLVEFFEGFKGRELYNALVSSGHFRLVRLRNGVKYVLVRLDRSNLRVTLEVFNNGTVKLHVRGDPIHQFEVRELASWILEFIREYISCSRIRLILRDFELSRIILDNKLVEAWKSLGLRYYKIYVHGNHIREEWRFSGYNILVTGQFTLQDVLEHIRLRLLKVLEKRVSKGEF